MSKYIISKVFKMEVQKYCSPKSIKTQVPKYLLEGGGG